MKVRKTFNFFVVAVLLIASIIISDSFAQDKQKTFTINSGDLLKVSSSFGNITYSQGSNSEVSVIAKNVLQEELDLLKMEKTGTTINIEFRGEDSHKFAFEITGPSLLDIDFSTGGGNIHLNVAMDGNADISTAGGNITTNDIKGKADISTAGGNIKIENVSGDVDASTAGGEINIGNVDGKADLSTAGGNIKVGSINSTADLSTGGGNISVIDVGGIADISTGGGNVKVGEVSGTADISTGGGNIKLESGSGKIETNTGAGNIKLKNITGYVDANTGAGNIYAEITPSGNKKSELNTGVGDIILMIPSNAKVNIKATVHVHDWDDSEKGMQHIESDFEPQSVNKDKSRKKIEAIFELNGGGPQIEINTGMGDIEIRKLK